jgi:D-3-phosphoglycerate dehydrogenase
MTDEALVVSTAPVPPELFAGALPAGTRVIRVDADEVVAAVPEAVVIIGDWEHRVRITREVAEAAVRCRLIQQPSAGYENIDIAAAAEAGIPVANAGPANAGAVAEHAIMGILGTLRQLREAISDAERGGWDQARWIEKDLPDLAGRTVGLLGFGSIGQAIAERLRPFGCNTIYHRRHRLDPGAEERLGASYADLDDLLRRSDVVVVALPLNDDTRHLLSAERLAMLPAGAVVVNVARGDIVDEAALREALTAGRLGGAAIDVFTTEPLPEGHPFGDLPNVILTPHIAGATAGSKRNILLNSLGNITRVLQGEDPQYVVNGVASRRAAT